MSASNGRSVGAGKTFTARDIAKSKVAKHLSDPFTARDLFGVVRAHCLAPGCECAEYWKATKDYTVSPGDMTGRSHPDNDVGIMKCSTCGHLPNAHAVAEAENHKQHGNDAFEWAQYDVALQRYSQGVERAPHDAKLRSNRAAVYMQLKQYQQALHDAEHAIKLEPQWAKPRSRKALAHLHLHQYEQAIQAYKMCIKLEPTNEDYKVALKEAQHRLARQKDPKGERHAAVSSIAGSCAAVLQLRADLAFQQRDYHAAAQLYSEAIQANPNDGKLWSNRSACAAQLQQYEQALADATHAAALLPKWDKGWSRKALALFYLQRYEEAIAAYDVAIRLAPGKESLLTARAESKAALLERTMAKMHSSACSASSAALPEKLHRPPSSTTYSTPSPAQRPPSLCTTSDDDDEGSGGLDTASSLNRRPDPSMHYDGGDAALESGSMRSSVSSARSSSRDIKAAKHQLAALHLQVATLEACRAALLADLTDLQTRGAAAAESVTGGVVGSSAVALEEDRATMVWVRLVAAGSAGAAAAADGGVLPTSGSPGDVFVCVTPDVTAHEVKLKVQAATNGAYMATRQMLACGGFRILGDTTRLSDAGFTFHPQHFLTCTLQGAGDAPPHAVIDDDWGLQYDREGGGGGDNMVLDDIEQQEEAANEFDRIPESNVRAPSSEPSSEPPAHEPRSTGDAVNGANLFQSLETPELQATKSWIVSQPSCRRRDDAGAGGALIGLLDPDLAEGEDDGGATNAFQSALLDTLNEARQTPVTTPPSAPDRTHPSDASPAANEAVSSVITAKNLLSTLSTISGWRCSGESEAEAAPSAVAAKPTIHAAEKADKTFNELMIASPVDTPQPMVGKRRDRESAKVGGDAMMAALSAALKEATQVTAQRCDAPAVTAGVNGAIITAAIGATASLTESVKKSPVEHLLPVNEKDISGSLPPTLSASIRSSIACKSPVEPLDDGEDDLEPSSVSHVSKPPLPVDTSVNTLLAQLHAERSQRMGSGPAPIPCTTAAQDVGEQTHARTAASVDSTSAVSSVTMASGGAAACASARAAAPLSVSFESNTAASASTARVAGMRRVPRAVPGFANPPPTAFGRAERPAAAQRVSSPGHGQQHTVKADQLLSILQSGEAGLVGAAPETRGLEAQPLDNRFAEMNEFFERCMHDWGEESSAEEDEDETEEELAAWAEQWEAEQWASRMEAETAAASDAAAAPSPSPSRMRRGLSAGNRSTASGPGTLQLSSLTSMLRMPVHTPQKDGRSVLRFGCTYCTGSEGTGNCGGYVVWKSGGPACERLIDGLSPLRVSEEAAMNLRCGKCWCRCEKHETAEQVRAREQAAAAERRRQQTRAQAAAAERARELELRRGRVVAAKQRAAAAARDGEDLQRSKADQMQGVERHKCGDCTECPGFECHFRAQDSLDVEVMFYCSLCGCAATSHEVSKEWKREERKKQQESSKRRDRERAQRQREQQQQANTVKLRKKEIGAYKVLQLPPEASQKQIRTQYRKLALQWHPDKNPPEQRERVQAKFIAITSAFQLISMDHNP